MDTQKTADAQQPAASQASFWWRKQDAPPCQAPSPKTGDICPACGQGRLAYDGLFILTCSACGEAAESGAFT